MPKSNPFKLPAGDPIRRELVKVFRTQRREVFAGLARGKKSNLFSELPEEIPGFHAPTDDVPLMTPKLEGYWDRGGSKLLGRLDLDREAWEVTNPEVQGQIERAALEFCEATNATTSTLLSTALEEVRAALVAGLVTQGESVEALTKRINAIFDQAEKWRARRIAQTEACRAVHAGQESAAIASEIVVGWEWLLSSDACPLCQTVARRCPRVALGQAFAVVGDHPTYSQVRFPPLHPHDNCTVLEIIDPRIVGGDAPVWSPTLIQPVPEDQDYPEALAA